VIVPSIDLVGGRAVQLVEGEQPALDAGDPLAVLERFGIAGEVAVVDIDAARGEGDNHELIEKMIRRADVRVGGGIRDVATALDWLDRGAAKVIIGTAATPDMLEALPADRVIVALDERNGAVVTHGWRRATDASAVDRMVELNDLCGGFLVTFVEREGHMEGTDIDRARRLVASAGAARVTIAGGITSAAEIALLDRIGADAQVGMALYTGALGLAEAIAAPLQSDRPDGLWPTVVADRNGTALGLAWSSLESLDAAVTWRRGVYQSRSRGLWEKGTTSGATQALIRIDVDCDRDAIRFTVDQAGAGFCHLDNRSCWGADSGITELWRRITRIGEESPKGSNTARLFANRHLLDAKVIEEAYELVEAADPRDVVGEAADLLYFLIVKAATAGVTLAEVETELDRRARRVIRRPMRSRQQA
jgi:phosphoribosyl-ATP pyrophosphohydrolase/phosphoribosyl-AMP cyclohydrolase